MTLPSSSRTPATLADSQVQARLLALVGMPGAGKSLLAEHLKAQGFPKVRFGQITIDEVLRRGWKITPANEQLVREEIRAQEGMDAMRAARCLTCARRSPSTTVWSSMGCTFGQYRFCARTAGGDGRGGRGTPGSRYERLAARPERPLSAEEAEGRNSDGSKRWKKAALSRSPTTP